MVEPQERQLEAMVVQGKDGRPVAIAMSPEDYKGVILLFDRNIRDLPSIGEKIYTYFYEVRVKPDGKKYGIVYSWHRTAQDALNEKVTYEARLKQERYRRAVEESLALVNALPVSDRDKAILRKLITDGAVPSAMDRVYLVFLDRGEDYLDIAVYTDQGRFSTRRYEFESGKEPVYVSPRLVKMPRWLWDEIEKTFKISKDFIYISGDTYVITSDEKEKAVFEALKTVADRLGSMRIQDDVRQQVAQRVLQKLVEYTQKRSKQVDERPAVRAVEVTV